MTPPLAIRMIYRRQIAKWPAIAVCIVFALINLAIFIALGSESKSHAVVFFMALVSYWILRKEHFINDRKTIGQSDTAAPIDEASDISEVNVTSDDRQKLIDAEPSKSSQLQARFNYRQGLFRIWVLVSLGWAGWFLFGAYEYHQELKPLAAKIKIAEERNSSAEERERIARENASIDEFNLNLEKNRFEIEQRQQNYRKRKMLGQLTEEERANPFSDFAATYTFARQPNIQTPLQILKKLSRQEKEIEDERNQQILIAIGGPVLTLLAAIVCWWLLSWVFAGFRGRKT